ncbi:E3 ubiquitin- ligase Zswim2 [Fusarium albosuccineum]|uniref:E3 ubiquitin- ligase Zswim2 n=1 Tax=Fusarium albosuccineum TaxID=1237068 RepID=A0A8H4PFV2_9HYPO|nr:E3 ubiquitin- ligase Zswim2 [Fusarium albosuccineum]
MGSSRVQPARGRGFNAGQSPKTPQKPVSRNTAKSRLAGRTPEQPIDLTGGSASPPPSRKRKVVDLESTYQLDEEEQGKPKKKKAEKEEKRVRRFRPHPPQSFHDVYGRALSQRFYVLNRTRGGTDDCPEEDIEMTGSTGNIYNVHIGKRPSCTCPHFEKGNQCKHILYVMSRVLNAPFNLVYQLALLSTELCSIFAAAPAISAHKDGQSDKRKPIEGDCPICYCELEANSPESIVWCTAACGQNIHQECFKMWAQTKRGSGNVTCPMCRSVWKGDESMVARVRKDKGDMEEGYVNVADQLGISRDRGLSWIHLILIVVMRLTITTQMSRLILHGMVTTKGADLGDMEFVESGRHHTKTQTSAPSEFILKRRFMNTRESVITWQSRMTFWSSTMTFCLSKPWLLFCGI